MSPAAGELVTETLGYDSGRLVTAYVPPDRPEAVVFAGDGRLIASWGGVLEAVGLPPTMIVGAHRHEDEAVRLREYSPGESTAAFAFDPERFAAHEEFFTGDARRWADVLRGASADVVMAQRAGSHGGAFWREEFPLMVAWAFGR